MPRLTRVVLDESEEWITVTFEWQGKLPQPSMVRWVVQLRDARGEHRRDLRFEEHDCDGVAHYVLDHRTKQMENVRGARQVADGHLVAAFPRTAVLDLGMGWSWRAVLSVDLREVSEFRDRG
jgi:hypothetical protein